MRTDIQFKVDITAEGDLLDGLTAGERDTLKALMDSARDAAVAQLHGVPAPMVLVADEDAESHLRAAVRRVLEADYQIGLARSRVLTIDGPSDLAAAVESFNTALIALRTAFEGEA